MRAVLREAAEIDQTIGLIRPVTINLCGLVLSRFSSALPRRFRGGLIRGFLRESLSLPEVRDVAEKLISRLITDNVTKRPRTTGELARLTALSPSVVRASLRRLGESDRAIVRPLDQQHETWEISHDFLVPLLDTIVACRTVSLWRRLRPWLPWAAAAVVGTAALAMSLITPQNHPLTVLNLQNLIVSENRGVLKLLRGPRRGMSNYPPGLPISLDLAGMNVNDVSALRELEALTGGAVTKLDLRFTRITDVSALRDLKNLTELYIDGTSITDISALRDLKSLTMLSLSDTKVTDLSALRDLRNLTYLEFRETQVTDISALRDLKNLTQLPFSETKVTDVSALRDLKNLTFLDFGDTRLTDISALRDLKNLSRLEFNKTKVTDVSALRDLKNLTELHLAGTSITDISALRNLKSLTKLNFWGTKVTDVS